MQAGESKLLIQLEMEELFSKHEREGYDFMTFTLLCLLFYLVPQEILVTAPEMQEEFLFSGNKTIFTSD